MANRTYLLNSCIATSDPELLRKKLADPGNDYAEVATAAYRIPISWLCCFRQTDLQTFTYQLENDNAADVTLPVVSVQQALVNLRAALPLFVAIARDSKIAQAYWQESMTLLESLPLPYLSIDALEVMFMAAHEPYMQSLRSALSGDSSALPFLKDLSCFEDGAKPYPPDFLRSIPVSSLAPARCANAVALDGGHEQTFWHLAKDSPERQPPISPASSNGNSLGGIAEGIRKVLTVRKHVARTEFGLSLNPTSGREELKLLIIANTDTERNAMLTDRMLMDAVFSLFQRDLTAVCQQYNVDWSGFVLTSNEYIQRKLKSGQHWNILTVIERGDPPMPSRLPLPKPAATKRTAADTAEMDFVSIHTEPSPGFWGKSTEGRIGRLRYLAFSTINFVVFSLCLLGVVLTPGGGMLFAGLSIVFGILSFWISIRSMVMRLHDINLSGKWLLLLPLLSGVCSILQMSTGAALIGGIFWLGSLALCVWPGDDSINAYAPPPDPEPRWVKIAAMAWIALMPLGILGIIFSKKFHPTGNEPIVTASLPPSHVPNLSTFRNTIRSTQGAIDLPAAKHGGIVFGELDASYEVVILGRAITVYLTDQDRNFDFEDATGRFSYQLLPSQSKRSIALVPLGKDKMVAILPDKPLDTGDFFGIDITPQGKARTHFMATVPDPLH